MTAAMIRIVARLAARSPVPMTPGRVAVSVAGRGSPARVGGGVRRDPPSAVAAGGGDVLLAVAAFQIANEPSTSRMKRRSAMTVGPVPGNARSRHDERGKLARL